MAFAGARNRIRAPPMQHALLGCDATMIAPAFPTS